MAASSACSYSLSAANSPRSRTKSARSVSDWELTETYSPAAIDIAPATKPAMPATRMVLRLDSAAATPKIKLAVETIPSLAPRTAARSHPVRCVKCCSAFLIIGLWAQTPDVWLCRFFWGISSVLDDTSRRWLRFGTPPPAPNFHHELMRTCPGL